MLYCPNLFGAEPQKGAALSPKNLGTHLGGTLRPQKCCAVPKVLVCPSQVFGKSTALLHSGALAVLCCPIFCLNMFLIRALNNIM